jgi:hypothetical protein
MIICTVMAQRNRVDEIVAATGKMLWGSLGAVYRRCGRKGCHCASGGKHGPVFYLTRSEAGRTRNIYVPEELRQEVEAGVAAYRRYGDHSASPGDLTGSAQSRFQGPACAA